MDNSLKKKRGREVSFPFLSDLGRFRSLDDVSRNRPHPFQWLSRFVAHYLFNVLLSEGHSEPNYPFAF